MPAPGGAATQHPQLPRTVPAVPLGDNRLVPVTVMPAVLAGSLGEADLTCSETGATAGVLPPGYHHLHRHAVIGSGPQVSAASADVLACWGPFPCPHHR